MAPAASRWQALLVAQWQRQPTSALCQALRPVAALHGALAAARRSAYRHGLLAAHRLPVPVLVVGNLVAGGAGKTPVVLHLLQALQAQGWQVGVVARGHGGSASGARRVDHDTPAALVGDEPLLVHLRGGVPVAVGRRRVDAARLLLQAQPQLSLLVADDGLQHLALARNAQVIVWDARGAGNGLLLPAGPLREPMAPHAPPRSVVLYSAGEPSTPWPGWRARRSLRGLLPLADWWAGSTDWQPLAALLNRPLWAAAGIAQPHAFFDMLTAQGLAVQPLPLPDHHGYAQLPWPAGATDVVLTEKDAVKLPPQRLAGQATRVWVAALDCQPEPGFIDAVSQLLPRAPPGPPLSPAPTSSTSPPAALSSSLAAGGVFSLKSNVRSS